MTGRPGRTLAAAVLALAVPLVGCTSDGGGDGRAADRPPAKGKPSKNPSPDDLNGDGYGDFAYTVQPKEAGTYTGRNTLIVVPGSPDGLDPHRTRRFENIEQYGTTPRGDLDGDGYTDLLALRTTGEETIPVVLYGGPHGVSAPRRIALPAGFTATALSLGDFDGDGRADLYAPSFRFTPDDRGEGDGGPVPPGYDPEQLRDPALPADEYPPRPAATESPDPRAPAGPVAHGPFDRRSGKPSRVTGTPGNASADRTVIGDFNGDGRDDALLTYDFHTEDEQDDDAPVRPPSVRFHRSTPRGMVVDPAAPAGSIAADLASVSHDGLAGAYTGDVDGDGIDDVITPAANHVRSNSGGVRIRYGSREGLGEGRPDQLIGGSRHLTFGQSTTVGEINGDSHPDLLIDTPGYQHNNGKIVLVPGGPGSRPDWTRFKEMDALAVGLPPTPNPNGWNAFNHLALLDTDNDGHEDAIILDPLMDKHRGLFIELRGGKDGFAPHRHRTFRPADTGAPLKEK
ncbi:FG-GAP repeat domain-containing protein [Streptomyces sp. DSM 118878]